MQTAPLRSAKFTILFIRRTRMHKQSSIISGGILILVGVFLLLAQFFPGLATIFDISRQWPLIVVAVGVLFLLSALVANPPLAVPGMIVGGIGGILYYQNLTGNWASWAYIWALIPGFVGLGLVLMGLRQGSRDPLREGGRLVGISAILFLVFGAFFNGLGGLGQFWPVLLIIAGLWLLVRNRLPGRRSKEL
jgi:hypothetical protein